MQIFNQETELEDSTQETRLKKPTKTPTKTTRVPLGQGKGNTAASILPYVSSAF